MTRFRDWPRCGIVDNGRPLHSPCGSRPSDTASDLLLYAHIRDRRRRPHQRPLHLQRHRLRSKRGVVRSAFREADPEQDRSPKTPHYLRLDPLGDIVGIPETEILLPRCAVKRRVRGYTTTENSPCPRYMRDLSVVAFSRYLAGIPIIRG